MACTQKNAPENSSVKQLIEVEAESDLPWLARDFSIPHFMFRHENKEHLKLEDNNSHMPIRYGVKCNGEKFFLAFHGKFKFRDPNVPVMKGRKVAIRNISDYALQ